MERLRRSLRQSFRRRSSKDSLDDPAKPHQWQKDEAAVRAGTCSFSIKYLGCVEVYESRGMQVCEEALKVLRNTRRRTTRGVLYVSGDGLRVVDAENKAQGLIVDQTIEKVSFCAPDRNNEKGFAYICRDGTTRRWMCHGFLAIKDSGERLSHAVGCAFAVCLEQKQKRDREAQLAAQMQPTPVGANAATASTTLAQGDHAGVQVQTAAIANYPGSFRRASLAERKQDPQNVIPYEKPPLRVASHPNAVARPAPNRSLFERQGSLRMPAATSTGSPDSKSAPFQRYSSLRLNQFPSSLAKQNEDHQSQYNGVSAIWEGDEEPSAVSNLSQQFSRAVTLPGCAAASDSPRTSLLHGGGSSNHAAPRFAEYGAVANNNAVVAVSSTSSEHHISSISQANGANKSRGEEWLQTAATQAKMLQQLQFSRDTPPLSVVSVPSTSFSSSPIAGLPSSQQMQTSSSATNSPRPSQQLPYSAAAYSNVVESSHPTPDHVTSSDSTNMSNTTAGGPGLWHQSASFEAFSDKHPSFSSFEDKWALLESKRRHSTTAAQQTATNPFTHESPSVRI